MRKALDNGRCPNHGGLSTGPKTAEGRAQIATRQRERWQAWRKSRTSSNPEPQVFTGPRTREEIQRIIEEADRRLKDRIARVNALRRAEKERRRRWLLEGRLCGQPTRSGAPCR